MPLMFASSTNSDVYRDMLAILRVGNDGAMCEQLERPVSSAMCHGGDDEYT